MPKLLQFLTIREAEIRAGAVENLLLTVFQLMQSKDQILRACQSLEIHFDPAADPKALKRYLIKVQCAWPLWLHFVTSDTLAVVIRAMLTTSDGDLSREGVFDFLDNSCRTVGEFYNLFEIPADPGDLFNSAVAHLTKAGILKTDA
jgi:hypothetical protein